MKKRVLSLIICACLLVTALCGCGDDKKSSGSGSKGSTFEYLNKMPDKDLDGYNFVIAEACYYGSEDRPNMEAGASDLSDAILARNKAIEEKFNCTISYEYYDPTSFYDEMYPIIMSGEKVADIMDVTLFTYGKLSVGEYLYDMSKLPHVNFKKDHWIDIYDDTVSLASGERYGASAAFANPYTHGFGIYFNKRLISELGLEDPYKLLKEGKWNWETFGALLNKAMKDVDSDAAFGNNDIYSITGGLDGGITSFYLANGLNMFDIDDNGFVRYAMTDENVIPTLTTLKSMFAPPGAYYYGGGDSSLCTEMFINGQVTFYMNLTTRGQALREMEDEYGLVPVPMGPDVDKYYSAIDHNTPIVCVPSSIDNPEATGLILEALAATSYSELDVWQEEIATLYYSDDESAKVLSDYILPNVIYDPVFMYSRIDKSFEAQTITAIFKPIARDPNADAATIINSGKDAVQALIDEVINQGR